MKYLIVVDMQNDFITGSLANKDAELIVEKVVDKIDNFDSEGCVLFTFDTHNKDYLKTLEGSQIPEHCIYGTTGWELNPKIADAYERRFENFELVESIEKPTFGFINWKDYIKDENPEIEIIGICTDICVISNAVILRALFKDSKITVYSSCCAGTTPENHNNALNTMNQLQIEIL